MEHGLRNILMIRRLKRKICNFYLYTVFLAINKDVPMLLKAGFVVQDQIYAE